MFPRQAQSLLLRHARGFPALLITGPRQSGKTTLARASFPDKPYVSLEDLDARAFAQEDPRGFLDRHDGGAILDEVQHVPDLLSYLQGRLDADPRPGRFVLTGSQHFALSERVTQSLAGRVGVTELLPLAYAEIAAVAAGRSLDDILFTGLYPALYDRDIETVDWYGSYVFTYVERDLRALTHVQELATFQRFMRLCAARTGQLLNLTSLATDCGIAQSTARQWLSLLETSYLVYLLTPHHRNFGKRLVKTPKLYFHDTGLATWLLGIRSADELSIHASRPALFETFAIGEILKTRRNRGLPGNLHFWRDNTGNEIDLLIDEGGRLHPVEIKSGQTVSADWFKGLQRWQAYAGGEAGEPALLYGGAESYTRSGIRLTGWRQAAGLAQTGD